MNDPPFDERVDTVFAQMDSRHPDPPEPPTGWSGGEAKNSGGAVVVREWIHETRGIRVTYSLDELVVAIERVSWDEQIHDWEFAGVVAQDQYETCESDREAMKTAFELMKRINAGQISVEGA